MRFRICCAVVALAFGGLLTQGVESADRGFQPPDYGRKWAIIIGIGQYQGVGFLPNPANDARAMRDLLIEDFGYNREDICFLSDAAMRIDDPSAALATREAIRDAFLVWLADRHPAPEDSLLVYFAGHGSDDPSRGVGDRGGPASASGQGYLAALKTKLGDVDSWIKLSDMVSWMQAEGIPCSHRLLILDCCYSGELFQRPEARGPGTTPGPVFGRVSDRGIGSDGQPDSDLRYYLSRPAFYGISAGRDYSVPDGDGGGHSSFTSVLLRELRDRADSSRRDQAFTFRRDLAPRIERTTPSGAIPWQIPDWGRLADGDGDFLFRPIRLRPTPSDRATTAERIAFSRDEISAGRFDVAERLLDLCAPWARAWEWNYLKEICRQEGRSRQDDRSPVAALAFRPTVPELAAAHDDGKIEIIEALGGDSIRTLQAPNESACALAYSPDGSLLAVAGKPKGDDPGRVTIWEAGGEEPARTLLGFRGSPLSLAFTKDGSRLLVGGEYAGPEGRPTGEIKVWNTAGWDEVKTIDVPASPVACVSAGPNGRWFHTAGPNGGGIWNAETFQEVVHFEKESAPAAVGPEGMLIATAMGNIVAVLDAGARKPLGAAGRFTRGETEVHDLSDMHQGPITSLAFTPDGQHIITVGRDGSTRLEVVQDGTIARIIEPGLGPLTALAIRPDGNQFAIGSADGRLRTYDMSRFDGTRHYSTFGTTFALAIAPDGCRIAVTGQTGNVQVRDISGHGGGILFRPFEEPANGLAFVTGGSRLAVGSKAGEIRLLDSSDGRLVGKFEGHEGSLLGLVASPDGGSLVSVGGVEGQVGEVKLWNVATGAMVRSYVGHADRVWDAAFAPRGDRLATLGAGDDPTLRVWEVGSGQLLKTITLPWGGYDVEFSPDGRLLAVNPGGLPQEQLPPDHLLGAMLWDAQTYQPLGTVAGHSTSVSGLAFTPDSRRLATSGMDGFVRIWDVSPESRWGEETHRPALALSLNQGWADRLAFTPDGRRLIATTGLGIGRIDVWDAPSSPDRGLWPADELRGVISSLAISPDGRYLVEGVSKFTNNLKFGDNRGEVIVRDARSGATVARLPQSTTRTVTTAALDPGPGRLYVAGGIIGMLNDRFVSRDGFINILDKPSGDPRVLARSDDDLLSFAIAPKAKRIAAGGKIIRVWNTDTGEMVYSHEQPGVTFGQAAFDDSGRRLAVASSDNVTRLFDLETNQVRDLKGHRVPLTLLRMDLAGRRLASFANSFDPRGRSEFKLWDLSDATSIDLELPDGDSVVPDFLPDGRLVGVTSGTPRPSYIRIWDTGTGRVSQSYRLNSVAVSSLDVGGEGAMLVTGDINGELRLWDLTTIAAP